MSRAFRFQPRVEPVRGALAELPLVELAARLVPARAPCVFLHGWPAGASLLAFAPLCATRARSLAGIGRTLAALEPAGGDPVPGPFQGGFLGGLSYELGRAAESGLVLPPDPWAWPELVGWLFCDFLVELPGGKRFLVLGEEPGDGRAAVSARRSVLEQRAAQSRVLARALPRGPLARLVPPAEHARRITVARERIAEGEIYQANLSHRFTRAMSGDPLALFLRLSALHPAPYAGFLRWNGGALLSASPELLLEFTHDAHGARARTRPIKGTIARATNEADDRARRAALLASEKDRSELAMIVDLERNDLGRCARTGSVAVGEFPALESYASVHHLATDVVARPRAGVGALEVLAALFPGGSISGAPKLRSMEVIAELESEGRGFAYGSMLALDTRGEAWANLLIRTLLWRAAPDGAEVTFRVGGGITWGSDPAAEEAETEAKGRLLARATEG
jgi:para-aminobenzoate synthetase component 1